MAQTKNGDELKVGDRVSVVFEVTHIQSNTTGCNVALRTEEPLDTYNTGITITLSSKQTELVKPSAE